MESHLLQMRGLKLALLPILLNTWLVASFTDAWIETNRGLVFNAGLQSHLLQMRGLKPKSTQRNLKKRRRIFYRCVD